MLSRRLFLALLAYLASLPRVVSAGAGLKDTPPAQPPRPTPEAFMARCLDLARMGSERGEGTPYGAVIVRAGVIVGEGWNRTYLKHDATAHAETEAIRDAARRLSTRDLSECELYTNGGRPCPMCETAAYWAGLKKMRLEGPGGALIDGGPPTYGGC